MTIFHFTIIWFREKSNYIADVINPLCNSIVPVVLIVYNLSDVALILVTS